MKRHIYIKKGCGREYLKKILYQKETIMVGTINQRNTIYHRRGCTIINYEDSYEGGYHEYCVTIGSDKKKHLGNLIKELEENNIEFKED